MSKSKSKQQEALQFLDDLDNLAPPSASGGAPLPSSTQPAGSTEGEAEVFAFIDEITQKSSEPSARSSAHIDRPLSRAGTPTVRKSTERVKVGTPAPLLPGAPPLSRTESSSSRVNVGLSSRIDSSTPAQEAQTLTSAPLPGGGGWGWGSVWSTASTAFQQARSVVDEQVKNLPKNEQARKWGEGMLEYAKNAQLDKLGAFTPTFFHLSVDASNANVVQSETLILQLHRSGLQTRRVVNTDGHIERCCASHLGA